MATTNTKTNTAKIAIVNPINQVELDIPTDAIVSVNNFNLRLMTAEKVSSRGIIVDGDLLLQIQLGTKSSMKEPIAFAKEMADITEAIMNDNDGALGAFIEILSVSQVVTDAIGKSKIIITNSRLKAVLGL